MPETININIARIKVGEHEKRLDYDQVQLGHLAASIRSLGLINPICVVPDDEGYIVTAGHRRLAACKLCGMVEVPCTVWSKKDGKDIETAFAENYFREDISPIEQAAAIADVVRSNKMTLQEVAAMMRRTVHWVSAQIALTNWPEDVQEAVHMKIVSVAAASNIAVVTDDTYRNFLLRQACEGGATARTTAAWLQAFRAMQPAEQAVKAEPVPAGQPAVPEAPQTPCFFCKTVFLINQVSHVPICPDCVQTVRLAEKTAG